MVKWTFAELIRPLLAENEFSRGILGFDLLKSQHWGKKQKTLFKWKFDQISQYHEIWELFSILNCAVFENLVVQYRAIFFMPLHTKLFTRHFNI